MSGARLSVSISKGPWPVTTRHGGAQFTQLLAFSDLDRSLPWILFFPGIDPLPHAVVVYEILDKDLRFAAPTLLGLVPAPDEPVYQHVDGALLADVEAAAGHHLRIREEELTHLAEERRGARERS